MPSLTGGFVHKCHAVRCDTSVPPEMFMCRKHWRMVPKSMQQELWAVYVPGQEIRKDPTNEYMEVAFKIIEHVQEKEGITHG